MALELGYVSAISLEQIFVDKDANELLFNGYVLFARDIARTEPKIVYTLSGSPPSYTFVPYGSIDPVTGLWMVPLTSAGAFGLALYYYPYDAMGNIDLYFVQVFSVGGVLQFTRAEWPPNITSSPIETEVSNNFVPNGQFLLHTNIQGNPDVVPPILPGQISQAITQIAYGGWTFERPSGSTATDFVTFPRFGSTVENPDNSPRYAIEIENTLPSSGDTYKDLRLKFMDVNKFGPQGIEFTYAFTAQTNSGGSATVQLVLIKNFGTGGSATTETVLGTYTITNSYTIFSAVFSFGDNTGNTIGPNDDDYLQLAIRFPTSQIFDISLDDFILAEGSFTQPAFPQTTDSEFVYRSLAGFEDIPDYNSYNLYLPLILSPTGITYDESIIGKVFAAVYEVAGVGELLCNGAKYLTSGYSSDGIPYRRLFNKLIDTDFSIIPKFGTGLDFAKVYVDAATPTEIILSNNSAGPTTATVDGTTATGFTFLTLVTGIDTLITGYGANILVSNTVVGIVNAIGAPAALPSAGTSGFTVTTLDAGNSQYIAYITTTAAAGLNDLYFTFANTTNGYAFWFNVNGGGSAPSVPGYTLVEIQVSSAWTAAQVGRLVQEALSGFQISEITTVTASSIPAGAYFKFTSTGATYYVWYTKDGIGTNPFPDSALSIQVKLLSTDTAAIVAQKTQAAVNSQFFAVPDYRGLFLRGWDPTEVRDPGPRLSIIPELNNSQIGTYEYSQNLSHMHTSPDGFPFMTYLPTAVALNASGSASNINNSESNQTQLTGNSESRPINSSVNYVIKY